MHNYYPFARALHFSSSSYDLFSINSFFFGFMIIYRISLFVEEIVTLRFTDNH